MTGHSQVLLNTGDSFMLEFSSLPFSYIAAPGTLSVGGGVSVSTSGLATGEFFRLELFEQSVDEVPKVTRIFANSADMAGLWQDLQGAVRITMLNGSMTLNNLLVNVTTLGERPDPNGPFINRFVYQATFAVVPEPSTVWLASVGLGAFAIHRRLRFSARPK